MKQLTSTAFRGLILCGLLCVQPALAQNSKTYKESFKVDKDAVIELNTSYADIEFDTWDKNEVVVEAVITLEGASEEEARNYFEGAGIEIMGNSSTVMISTRGNEAWSWRMDAPDFDMGDYNIEIPEMPDLAPMISDIMADLPEIAAMPPMPPKPFKNFDYEAYQKDGEAYMKKWQKEFEKSFDKEYQKEMEEWSKEMEARADQWAARWEERKAERMERLEEQAEMRAEQREKMAAERDKIRAEVAKAREEAAKARAEVREKARDKAAVFYMRGAKGRQNFTIKKTIKIKMPKNTRLKMNVRHGEVKMAGNTLNMRANLSYSSLLASALEGENTLIEARYSPISVKSWKGGKLSADFSDNITLDAVARLVLNSTSSNIEIDRVQGKTSIQNNLGSLTIHSISDNFGELEVSVKNGEFYGKLPAIAYAISLNNKASEVLLPKGITWDNGQGAAGSASKGYFLKKGSGSSIVINASYSQVNLNN
jgi:hypothetical protein